MTEDLIDASEAVQEFFSTLHTSSFGRPHGLLEVVATADFAQVIVAGAVLDRLEGAPRSALYRVARGALTPLAPSAGSSKGPQISPDGQFVAFLSDRDGDDTFQPFIVSSAAASTASGFVRVDGSAEFVRWSPDGESILIGVAEPGAPQAGVHGSGRAPGNTDLPSWYPELDISADQGWRSLWVYSRGELKPVPSEGLNYWEAEWCGNQALVAIASTGPAEDDWYDSTLLLVDLKTGTTSRLALATDQLTRPTASPDASRVVFIDALASDRGVVAGSLKLVETLDGSIRSIDTQGVDVSYAQWLDQDRIAFAGLRGIFSVAAVIDLRTGAVEEVAVSASALGAGRYPEGVFTSDQRLLTVVHGYTEPPRISVFTRDDEAVIARLDLPGASALTRRIGHADLMRWASFDGVEIDGLLCRPDSAGPHPLIVNVHGGPVSAVRNSWLLSSPWVAVLVSRGFAVLSPNPRGSSGRGRDFAAMVIGDMGGAECDDHLSGIDALVSQGLADWSAVGVTGASHGGYMAGQLVARDSRFSAAVLVSPVTDWYSQMLTTNIERWTRSFMVDDPEQVGGRYFERSPAFATSRIRTPCLNIAGARDFCTPPGQAREFHQALRYSGVESSLVVYPEEGHGVRKFPALVDSVARTLAWFERYVRLPS